MDDLILSGRSLTFLAHGGNEQNVLRSGREVLPGEALLSEAGFARIGSVGATCFVDNFLVGASGVHMGCCLNRLEVSFFYFVASGGLIVCR